MSHYNRKNSLVAVLCLTLMLTCSSWGNAESTVTEQDVIRLLGLPDDIFKPSPDIMEEDEKRLGILRADLARTRAERERIKTQLEEYVAGAEKRMQENIATARAHARAVVESRGRLAIRGGELVERYELPKPSDNNRWVIVVCFNGAAISAMLALYFYYRWRKNRLLP